MFGFLSFTLKGAVLITAFDVQHCCVLIVMEWISLLMTLINIWIFTVLSILSSIIMLHGAKVILIPFRPL